MRMFFRTATPIAAIVSLFAFVGCEGGAAAGSGGQARGSDSLLPDSVDSEVLGIPER